MAGREIAPEAAVKLDATPTPPRLRVLVVGSDPAIAPLVKRLLGPTFEFQSESNPYRALVALEEEGPYALVVASQTLFDGDKPYPLDGIGLLETAYRRTPNVPRVLLAAHLSVPAAIEAVNRAHVTYLVTEPFRADALRQTLIDALYQSEGFDDGGAEIDLR